VLGEARQVPIGRLGAERQHELVVGQLLHPLAHADANTAPFDVDVEGLPAHEARAWNGHADRRPDVVRLDRARRDLGQHRCEQQVVAAADQGHVPAAAAGCERLEPAGGAHPREAATEDDDPRALLLR